MTTKEATMTVDHNGALPPPRIIPVGEEPPPLDDGTRAPRSRPHGGKPKGKADGGKSKARERFALLNAFVDFALAGLSRAEVAVWLVLVRDTRDGTARTSYDDLARRAGLNRRNVGRAVRRLERLGLLTVVHRGGLRRGASRYRVLGLPKG
jgi:predicted transcriptional regulator